MKRFVLYAEGAGELGSTPGHPLAPGRVLPAELEGPAHVLVRRCCRELLDVAEHALRFEAPLRHAAREVRGGDLRNSKVLRRVLHWADPSMRPDVAIVLVDQDGEEDRRSRLATWIGDPLPTTPVVLGVAVEEFEAWLITDHAAVNLVLELREDPWVKTESMRPGHAKERLGRLVQASRRGASAPELRLELAKQLDLQRARAASRSFDRFITDLKQAVARH
ncbi:MAG: DUF4276 family protein [Planctomycetes bacterium]|nr:DUF4276 family protein [Planctomycetota bacterium]